MFRCPQTANVEKKNLPRFEPINRQQVLRWLAHAGRWERRVDGLREADWKRNAYWAGPAGRGAGNDGIKVTQVRALRLFSLLIENFVNDGS